MKKTMKLVSLILAMLMVLSLTACGAAGGDDNVVDAEYEVVDDK